jgi:hypothetical protein
MIANNIPVIEIPSSEVPVVRSLVTSHKDRAA